VIPIHDIDVNNVLFKRQHKCGITTSLEVHFYYLVSLIEDVLVHGDEDLVKKWEYPSNEVVYLIIQKWDLTV